MWFHPYVESSEQNKLTSKIETDSQTDSRLTTEEGLGEWVEAWSKKEMFFEKRKTHRQGQVWWLQGAGGGGGGECRKDKGDRTWGGEHTTQCTGDMVRNWAPKTCIILLTCGTPINSIKRKKEKCLWFEKILKYHIKKYRNGGKSTLRDAKGAQQQTAGMRKMRGY